jgi:hypothetical protein
MDIGGFWFRCLFGTLAADGIDDGHALIRFPVSRIDFAVPIDPRSRMKRFTASTWPG